MGHYLAQKLRCQKNNHCRRSSRAQRLRRSDPEQLFRVHLRGISVVIGLAMIDWIVEQMPHAALFCNYHYSIRTVNKDGDVTPMFRKHCNANATAQREAMTTNQKGIGHDAMQACRHSLDTVTRIASKYSGEGCIADARYGIAAT
jgi:hypothetical protein